MRREAPWRGHPWLAALPLQAGLCHLLIAHTIRARDEHLLVELAVPGALTPGEWLWAKVTLGTWAALVLCGAVGAVLW
ncbi:MAG TPA: hypothetical protein VF615_04085 [Longimicrobiaceae bacterium]|jgi:hypothetical protein